MEIKNMIEMMCSPNEEMMVLGAALLLPHLPLEDYGIYLYFNRDYSSLNSYERIIVVKNNYAILMSNSFWQYGLADVILDRAAGPLRIIKL